MINDNATLSTKRIYFGVGSNLGDRWAYLSLAVDELCKLDADLVVSPIYETAPVGGPEQGAYLNCVVGLDSELAPLEVLDAAHEIEQLANRVRKERFGPRTLDVDVLLIDGYASDDPILTVPHPRMFERAFVMTPLFDIAPDKVPPSLREQLGESVDQGVKMVGELVRSKRS